MLSCLYTAGRLGWRGACRYGLLLCRVPHILSDILDEDVVSTLYVRIQAAAALANLHAAQAQVAKVP